MDMQTRIEPAAIIRMLDVLMRALATKVLLFVVTLMTFSLFSWAMVRATWAAFALASGFCIGVLWPLLIVGFYRRDDSDEAS